MRKYGMIIGIVLMSAALAYPVFGWGPGWGRGHHMMGYTGTGEGAGYCWRYSGPYGNLTEEQQADLMKLKEQFFDETSGLRNQIWRKAGELRSLLWQTEPDADKAKALQEEISKLKNTMAAKRLDFLLESRKIAPDVPVGPGYGKGFGRHMPGSGAYHWGPFHGGYMGRHGPYMGYGPGGCW
jgi:zinc resistance-associated protein